MAVVLLTASEASAQSNGRGDKLDKFLRHRAKQLSGRTRVIVQFKGDSDVRVLGKRAAAGRRLGRNSQVAEVDNAELVKIASNPRVKRVYLDRPIVRDDRTDRADDRSGTCASATGCHG